MGNRDDGRFILSDYLSCAVFAFCLNVFLFGVLMFPKGMLADFQMAWPWSFVPGATALFTGFYMTRKTRLSRPKCIFYMILQGIFTALLSLAVISVVYDDALRSLPQIHPCLEAFIYYVLVTSFFTGATIAFILLAWIRRQNFEYYEKNKVLQKGKEGGTSGLPEGKQQREQS